ncbi:MAG: SAM-dependent methyltransferase [Acetobacteraceae bacterium]
MAADGVVRAARAAAGRVIRAAYLAPEGYESPLEQELTRRGVAITAWHGRLALSPDPPAPAAWAQDIWTAPVEILVPSVKAGADALRALQRNWGAYAVAHHRRTALITERLPPVKARALVFPEPAPSAHLGAWTLLAPDRMLASPSKSSHFVNGECHFVEDRTGPPSRAYLKLWEACTRMGAWPGPSDRCLDLGASPGGWTWAIARLGAQVTAIDKAPLDPAVAAMPGVSERRDSAFALPPEPVDWLFSDVIAYPDRLLALVHRWIRAGAPRRIICTIKFQGETDHAAAEAFAGIPGGQVMHLFHNKHELTFVWAEPRTA